MDWNAAIEKHREALTHILAALVAMAGLGGQFTFFPREGASPGGLAQAEKSKLSPASTLPRRLRLAVLRLLRPAESAARRLIIAAARGLVVTLPRKANFPQARNTKGIPTILRNGGGTGIAMPSAPGDSSSASAKPRALTLPLFDPPRHPFRPRRSKQTCVPRISFPGFTQPFPVAERRPPAPDDAVDAGRLGRRLEALASALDDLPRQALRFARWRARRAVGAQNKEHDAGRIRRLWPLRMGSPPGSRRRPSHEVHDVLAAAHGLAFLALEHPDTS